jgi:hypothetical protein
MATQLSSEALAAEPADEAPAETFSNDVADFYPEDGVEESVDDPSLPEEGGEEAPEEPQLEPIAPPVSLTGEEKEAWKDWPRDVQEVVSRRINEMEKGLRNKAGELAQTRRNVESEARQAILKVQEAHVQQLEHFMLRPLPPKPDPRLLTGQEEHRALFYQQEAEYQSAVAQRNEAHQQIGQAQQQASLIEQAQFEADRQEFEQVMEEKLGTEWSDPSARQNLLATLQPIGAELGYPVELMARANATDILALRTAHTWKQGYDKWQAANKAKMEVVRKAKELPKVTQPGSSGGQVQRKAADPLKELYPND